MLGEALGQVLGNGQRVPDKQIAVLQQRHLAGRAEGVDVPPKSRARLKGVKAQHHLFKFNAGLLEQHPGPHRPGGVILVANKELEHGGLGVQPGLWLDMGRPVGAWLARSGQVG